MSKPLIGLPGRRKPGSDIAGFPEVLQGLDIDLYFTDYSRGVMDAGGLAVNIPVEADPYEVADRLDGILLPGGTDIDPARYGAEPHPELLAVEERRDNLEFDLFAAAMERHLPVLGICRGIQVINVQRGGTLNQHVEPHAMFEQPPGDVAHRVKFTEGSVLHGIYGEDRNVNSLHHQTVADVGAGLEVTARSDDGEIEALELGHNVLAVQWHPEMMPTRSTDPIFAWLVDRAAKRLANQ